MFDYDVFSDLVENTYGALVEISPFTKALCNSLISTTSCRDFNAGDTALTDEQKDEIDNFIATAMIEINGGTPIIPPVETETLFGEDAITPDTETTSDPGMLGLRFETAVSGEITHIRIWKPDTANTGYVGYLFSAGGSELATANFEDSGSGWIEAELETPYAIDAETPYIAAVFAPDATYALTMFAFTSDVTVGNITALADNAVSGVRNGVFCVCADGTFPTTGYQAINFYVDIRFIADE
jgi:hypothetical protein